MAFRYTPLLPLLAFLAPLSAQLTAPWQSDWDVFAREVAPLLRNSPIPAAGRIDFVTVESFADKQFEWRGEFASVIDGNTVLIAMNPAVVPLSTGGAGILFSVIAEVRVPADFRGLATGQPIRFKGRIDTMENIAIIRLENGTVTFNPWAVEVELVTSDPPAANIQLSAQGRTAANGQTLALTAPAGGSVAVNFSAASSTPGTGIITAYEWRNNNTVLDTRSTFTANLSAPTNDIQLKVTNTLGQTATATARVTVAVEQPTGPRLVSQNPVVHGASFDGAIASGTWITIRGEEFTTATRIWESSDFVLNGLPTSLNGISVKINNRDAFIYYISPTQLNVLSPDGLEAGTLNVEVTTPNGVARGSAIARSVAPGFFPFDPRGRIYPAAVHTDGTLAGPAGLFGAAAVTRPPNPNDTVLLYGSGFGLTDPPRSSAKIVDAPAPLANRPVIRVGGVAADLTFAGLVSSGLNQFNLMVPQVAPGDQPLVAESGGVTSQANLFLCVGGASAALAINQTTLTFNASTTGSAPPAQSLEVTSSGGPIAFRVASQTDSGGAWLTVDGGGQTPRALSVRVNTTGLAPGTYRGSITVDSCVNTAGPRVVTVTLTIAQTAPTLTSVSPNVVRRGENATLRLAGTNLASVIAVAFDPAAGITVTATRVTATEIQADIRVNTDAALGNRSVTVSTASARSNALTIRVDPQPAATQ